SPAPASARTASSMRWRRWWSDTWSCAPAPTSRSWPPMPAWATPPSRRPSMPLDEGVRPLAPNVSVNLQRSGEGADPLPNGEPDPNGHIWRGSAFYTDAWVKPTDGEPLPDSPVILSKTRWLAEGERLAGRNAPLGLQIEPGEAIDDLDADL